MEVFAILSSCVALIAITLIFNLFVNLRNTDKAVKNEVTQSEIDQTQKIEKKVEPKKAEPKSKKNKIRPNDFKHQTLLTNLKGHLKSAASGSYSKNGKFMVSCDGEQSIMFWIVKDFNKGNTCIRTTTDYNEVTQVSFSPDSKAILASLKNSNSTRVYKIAKKPSGGAYELISACDVADLNPKSALIKARIGVQLQNGIQVGAFLFHQYVDSHVVITDLRGCELARVKCQGGANHQIELSECGKYFAVCGDSPELRAWTIVFKGGKFIEVKRLPSLIGHSHKIIKFAFSPDSTRLITLDANNEMKFWDMGQDWVNQQTPSQLISFKNTFGNPAKLAISTDNMVVGLTHQNKLTVFDVNDRNNFSVISDIFESSIRHIEFDPSSDFVAVTGDKVVRIFHNLTGWKARLSDYKKSIQLASTAVHKESLAEQIKQAENKISELS